MKVSVAMAVRDGAAFLPDQLGGILAQGHPPDELVVVDDGSVDGSADLVEELVGGALPLRLLRSPEPTGPVTAFERAIASCEGDVIVLADQDDLWYPQKVARLLGALADSPVARLAYSDADLVDEGGGNLPGSLWSRLETSLSDHLDLARRPPAALVHRSLVSGCAMAFRSDLRDVALPFPDSLTTVFHDRWLALTAACTGGVAVVPDPLLAFRVHAGQLTGLAEHPSKLSTALREPLNPRAPHLRAMAAVLGDLEQRLADAAPPEVLARVRAARELLEVRASLPGGRIRRLPVVTGTLLRRGYGRAGLGLPAAVLDLLRPAS